MSSDTKFHVHHDAPEVVGRRERLGVRLLIVADGAFVFGMIFSYFYLRNLNTNNGWIPEGGHTFSAASGWIAIAPLIVAAILHKIGQRNLKTIGSISILTLIAYLYGLYFQIHQMANMPFIVKDTGGFEGAYASSWVLIAGANVFHYVIAAFLALGLVIRARRASVDPTLEMWRMRTTASWFTWIAISGVACAITTGII
jgi:heme/copper-type cytochrome/quinol oxidase subunit 3